MKYKVRFYGEVVWETVVEAEDREEAEEKALRQYEEVPLAEMEWVGESGGSPETELFIPVKVIGSNDDDGQEVSEGK